MHSLRHLQQFPSLAFQSRQAWKVLKPQEFYIYYSTLPYKGYAFAFIFIAVPRKPWIACAQAIFQVLVS